PVERGGVRDRDESEIALREPLPKETQRLLGVRGCRDLSAEQLAEAETEVVSEGRHVLPCPRIRRLLQTPRLGAADSGCRHRPRVRGVLSQVPAGQSLPRCNRATDITS